MSFETMPPEFYRQMNDTGSEATAYYSSEFDSLYLGSIHPEVLPYGGLEADELAVATGGMWLRLKKTSFGPGGAIERASRMRPEEGDSLALAA